MFGRIVGYVLGSSSQPQPSSIKIEDRDSDADANHDGDSDSDAEMDNAENVNGARSNADLTEEERARKLKEKKRLKNLRAKERKRRKRDALDSSVLGSSVLDSSVLGEDVEAHGIRAEEEGPVPHLVPSLPALSNGLNGNADEEEAVEEPTSKTSKKSARAAKQLKVEAIEENDFVESQIRAEPEVELESQDMVDVIRKERLATSKKAKQKKSKSSHAVEASPLVEEGEVAASGLHKEENDMSQLPGKIKKAKQRARSQSHLTQEQENGEDENDSAAPLHQRLTPAHNTRSRSRSVAPEDIAEAKAHVQSKAGTSARPDTIQEDEEDPKQPSKKALGKRKVSNTALESNPKRRKSKGKAPGAAKLTDYGFSPSQVPPSATDASNSRSRSRSPSFSQPSVEERRQITEMLWDKSIANEKMSPPTAEVPPTSSNIVSSGQQRRATPIFTPINPRKPTAATVDPTEEDPFVLPPSSQPQPESSIELPAKASTSGGRRKRRLPIGEPEFSQIKEKAKTPKRKSSVSKTPKPRASKLPNSSQVTPMSKGARLTEEDVEAIHNAVEGYRDQHDMEQENLNAMIQADASKEENREFWKYMYEEITTIPRIKILSHCRRKFHNFEARGSWTAEQDQDLTDAHERNPSKWKQIGAELNRFPEDCRDRWRNYLVCGDNQRKDAWDKEEEEKLKDIVEECVELIREDKRKGKSKNPSGMAKDDYSLLDWQMVSTKMGRTRSRLQCMYKWKLIREREDTEDEDPVAVQPIAKAEWRLEEAERVARRIKAPAKLQILYQIRDSKAGREGTIPWKHIQGELGIKGKKMALRVCYRSLKQHIPDSEDMKLQDIVSALIDLYESSAPMEPHGFEKFISPARQPSSAKHKSRLEDDGEDEDSEEVPTNSKKQRKSKKLRTRMKRQGQLDSQGTNTDSAEFDDSIGESFQAAKTTPSKSPKAKKPLTKPRRSKHRSDYRAMDSEDEAQQEELIVVDPTLKPNRVPNSEHNVQLQHDEKPDDEVQHEQDDDEDEDGDIQQNQRSRRHGNITLNEQEVPESDHFTSSYDQHTPPNNDYLDSVDEEEDYSLNTHDQESVDLDEPHHITTNGFHISDDSLDEMEDESRDQESSRGREESTDLGGSTPLPMSFSRESSLSVSSDASTIPHTPRANAWEELRERQQSPEL